VLLTLPICLLLVPWPTPKGWLILGGAMVIHFFYKLAVALAYDRAAYTVVYPVIRGTGPLVTVAAAAFIFNEHFTAVQWLGVGFLSGGILLLALRNLSETVIGREALVAGLGYAVLAGLLVAIYTTYDAFGIREAVSPFTFLAWFFLLTALDFPIIALVRYRRMDSPPTPLPLLARGILGAVIAYVSFGGVMLATYLDKIGEAAVLRETSTVFAAMIGWLVLGERVGPRRAILMCLIALGAVVVEFGG
jgi:drug/metabolite transporter (DMT)-like permease